MQQHSPSKIAALTEVHQRKSVGHSTDRKWGLGYHSSSMLLRRRRHCLLEWLYPTAHRTSVIESDVDLQCRITNRLTSK